MHVCEREHMHAHYIFLVLCMSTVYHSQNLIFGKKMKDLRWTAMSVRRQVLQVFWWGAGGREG